MSIYPVSLVCWLCSLLATALSAPGVVLPGCPALGGECIPWPGDLTTRRQRVR